MRYYPARTMQSEQAREGSTIGARGRWGVILLMLFVASLSLLVFSRQSLRLDEAQSLWQTSHSTAAMIHIIAEDVHVPLYHLMLHFWQFAFGNDVTVARLLSVMFFILIIPAIYALGRLAYGRRVGLFAAALMAISPFLNWYGNEIRMYSLFALLTIINQYFFVSIFMRTGEERDVRSGIWFGYAVTFALGMFTHYFFALNALAQAAFYVAYRRVFPQRSFGAFAAVALLGATIYAPWLIYVGTLGSAENTRPHLLAPTTVDLFNTFSQFIFGFQTDHLNTILVSLWPILVLLIFMALRRHMKIEPQTVYLFFSLFVPITTVFLVSLSLRPIYLSRYLILSLPSLYLLMSWVLSVYPPRLSRIVRGALILGMAATLAVEIANAGGPVKEDYRGASEYISSRATAQDVIVLSAPFTIYPFEYYYRGDASLETIPRWNRLNRGAIPVFDEGTLPDDAAKAVDDHQRLWLLLSYDQGYEDRVRLYFDTRYERLETKNFSKGLDLYTYRLRY